MPRAKNQALLRQKSNSKMELKEKIIDFYDIFFQGKDPSRENPNFWDEFFLLKANVKYIEGELANLSSEQLFKLKETINNLFYHSVVCLKDEYPIRIINALQTLSALVRGVCMDRLADHGFDVINVLMGFDSAETLLQDMIQSLNSLLVGEDYSVSLKNLTLRFLLVLATITDNVSQNTLMEYMMINSVFESLITILSNPVSRQEHGYEAILLLAILVNYRKYESANPYIVKLSILDDEVALTGLGWVISSVLTNHNQKFRQNTDDTARGGWFNTLSSMVGNMFVPEAVEVRSRGVEPDNAILLVLYEAVHLNRNFITILAHHHAEPVSPTPTTPVSPKSPAVPSAAQKFHYNPTTLEPLVNIQVTFLCYCSIIMQDLKDAQRYSNTKLCLIIISCIAEDQYANSFLHDANLTFRVPLHRAPMRHRKPGTERDVSPRPLACAVLDLMVEFIMSHMMKTLPQELLMMSLGIIHRLMCYQKKCRVRLQYPWKDLWTALISLLKYMLSNESILLPSQNIFELACKVVNLFNLFITYGDTFLPTAGSYDELYYEIIRMHQVFDNLYSLALRHSTNSGEYKATANKLTNCLVNIRAIVNHFTPKVDSVSAMNSQPSLSADQVLEVVRQNYDTLTLKLQDSLDQYERYAEKPRESAFFTELVRSIILKFRGTITVTNLEQQSVLQEFSTIH
ncbi:Armadillo-like helical domain-containing protein 3 [Holothuria leucospilota]|uniref:Armadillo-like helical domain-containing protein 3 n=1 Tax=Holothuria leucospilota TaxID=206669 RepID=A0A9Q0YSS6_HOLLE|nr:Armadillo-like helical domain-containing protein 3 [Holothuria leucospilota]